ncbi:MAG: hypothetical protein M8353_00420 [ANME-2 cluster archaeon]|nr:hypothetical protein [ANME-2 cluster archaeon]MDF1531921.1 hypothetical protein [ANME-2 cluster archaeon]MDW7776455.1 hypothetical protein [Methanosarcinales archaeon]
MYKKVIIPFLILFSFLIMGCVEKTQNPETKVVKERDFWFAWYAFHPDTTIYSR